MQLRTKFLTFVKLESWNCSKIKTCLTLRWTRIILKKRANSHNQFYWGYLFPRPVQPAAYSASKEIFWSGWKIPLQSKHIWLRMWRHLPTFKGLPNIKALPSLSLSLFSISLLEHNTIRNWFLGKVSRKKSCCSFGFCPNYLPPICTTCTTFFTPKNRFKQHSKWLII